MKVLVLSAAYPKLDGSVGMYYVHSRNCYYQEKGIQVEVLNFGSLEEYSIDGIKVFGIRQYVKEYLNTDYDILILHAANIKFHYRFLKKYGDRFEKFLFFFHGHEVLRCSKVYPKPYDYVEKESRVYKIIKDIYDIGKLKFWRRVFKNYLEKSWFVFVSEWMFNEFQKWIGLGAKDLNGKYSIIYNCIGKIFETEQYVAKGEKEYDYISIRDNFDESKYGVDIITTLARENPDRKFYLLGKGEYFQHREKPDNLIVENIYLDHKKIIQLLNKSKCALMPTRTDAQGVMACEMATFGIPLITSDIDVCREVFEGFSNVEFIDNEEVKGNLLEELYCKINMRLNNIKNEKYFSCNTSEKEVELIYGLLNKNDKMEE